MPVGNKSSTKEAPDAEWSATEAEFEGLLDERQRMKAFLELEEMKQALLQASPAGSAPAPRSAWDEPAPPLATSASLAALNSADDRLARLMMGDDGDDSEPLTEADRARLAALLG